MVLVAEPQPMVNVLISVLLVALVWVLTAALGMPYLVSLVVTILAALYIFSAQGLLPGRRARRRAR
ncbi:MAG: hypothetical protein ACJ780_13985 [Solirubrobacteraceae bacterium]